MRPDPAGFDRAPKNQPEPREVRPPLRQTTLLLVGGYLVLAVVAAIATNRVLSRETDCAGLDFACAFSPLAAAVGIWIWYATAALGSALALVGIVFLTRIRSSRLAATLSALAGLGAFPLVVLIGSVLG